MHPLEVVFWGLFVFVALWVAWGFLRMFVSVGTQKGTGTALRHSAGGGSHADGSLGMSMGVVAQSGDVSTVEISGGDSSAGDSHGGDSSGGDSSGGDSGGGDFSGGGGDSGGGGSSGGW